MEGTIGEIRLFAGTFAPRTWAFCEGQIMAIAQNTALFSILGTTYGGNGQTTFALPDLRGRTAVGPGTGPGLTNRNLGEQAGTENVTLIASELPAHNHNLLVANVPADKTEPTGNSIASVADITENAMPSYKTATPNVALNPSSISPAGGSQPHNNMPPYLGMNYIICLEGIFPSRN
jgi:microcystin-dependent protein